MGLLFNKKVTLIERQAVTVGEFNIEIDGAYDNVKTFPLDVRKGKNVYVSVKSDNGVDVCIVGLDGMNKKYAEAVKDKTLGPVPTEGRGKMALILAVYRGDLAHAEIEAWME